MQTQLLINGAFVDGEGAAETIVNPATGEQIATVPEASLSQIEEAVAAADAAFPKWARTTPQERSLKLLQVADQIEKQAEAFAELESLNTGKPPARALGDELPAIVDCFRFFAGAARCVPAVAAGEYLPGLTSMIRRDPVGVVAQVAPWNYPLMMAAWKLAPALAAGNTVVLKPSEQTPLTTLKLAEILAAVYPSRRGQHRDRPRRHRRRTAGQPRPGAHGLAHRQPRGRHQGAGGGRGLDQAHPSGARRQGAGDRLRRRRPGGRGRGAQGVRLLQCRPGLHRRLPHLRRGQDPRPAGGRPGCRRRLDPVGRAHAAPTWTSAR